MNRDSDSTIARPRPGITPRSGVPAGAALRPIALVAVAFGALSTTADPDIWGHVRFGLDILDRGVHGGPDPYSFTADRPFLYHEWLGGVLMAVMYRLGGPPGLMALKAVLACLPTLTLWIALRRTQLTWRWLGLAMAGWGGLALAFTLRPQLWTAVAVIIVGLVLSRGSTRALWVLPPMFALWANLHGGWIVGGGMLAVWTAVAWLERNQLRWTLLGVGVLSLASTLLTPHGLDLWSFLLETVRLNRNDISEWSPIWRAGTGFMVMWGLTAALCAFSWRRHGRPSLAPLVVLIGLAVSSARVNRLVPLFAVIAVTLLSRQWPADSPRQAADKARAALDSVAVAIMIAMAAWLGAIPHCIELRQDGPDTLGAEALRGTRGRLVTYFDWGEYALWHFGPGLKVSIDGRRETVYSMPVLEEQRAIDRGTAQGIAALQRIRPEYVWLPARSSAAASWLRENGYREDVRTERSFVAVRDDLPRLSPFIGESSGCFPGP